MNDSPLARWGRLAGACLLALCGLTLCAEAQPNSTAEQPPGGDKNPAATSTAAAARQFNKALELQKRKVHDLAVAEWQAYLEKFPADALVASGRYNLGLCHIELKQLEPAIEALDKVVREHPKFEFVDQAYLLLGNAQYRLAQGGKKEQYDKAAATYGTLAKNFPKAKQLVEALYFQADATYYAGRKDEAAKLYGALVEKHADHRLAEQALYYLGVTREELKQADVAGDSYDAYLKKYPQGEFLNDVTMRRGQILLDAKQFEPALAWFAKAAAAKGYAHADLAQTQLAECQEKLGQFDKAAAAYAEVSTKFPKSPNVALAQLGAGRCAYQAKKYDAAREALAKVAGEGDVAIEAGYWLAQSWLKAQQPAQAAAAVEKVLAAAEKSPLKIDLLMLQADALYELPDRMAEAAEKYAAVAASYPQSARAPEALYNSAFASLRLNKHDDVTRRVGEFLKAYPEDKLAPSARFLQAESQLVGQKFAAAEASYVDLLAKHPQHADATTWKLRWAIALQAQQKYAETIAALKPLAGKLGSPEAEAEAQLTLGQCQLQTKAYDDAVKSLQGSLKASATWRRADETFLNLSRAYAELKQTDQAKSALQNLMSQFPRSKLLDTAHYRLGEIAFAAGDFSGASSEYKVVAEKFAASALAPAAMLGLGIAQHNLKDYATAARTFSDLLEKHPQSKSAASARYSRALAKYELKDYAAALDDLQAYLAGDPPAGEKSEARYAQILCLVALKKSAEVSAAAKALLADDANYSKADGVLYEQAWALKNQGQENESLQTFTSLADKYPDSPHVAEAHFRVAEQQYKKEQYELAAVRYAAASTKAGKSELGETATHMLGWTEYRRRKFAEAAQAFDRQLRTFPEGRLTTDATFMAGECLFEQGRFADAFAHYQKIDKFPNKDFRLLAQFHGGQSLAKLKEPDWKQSAAWLKACADDPGFADFPYAAAVYYELGWAQQNLGQSAEAIKLYEAAIDKAPGTEAAARAAFMTGEILFEQKKHQQAISSFVEVISSYKAQGDHDKVFRPWRASATYEAARCFEALKNAEQARKFYQELVDQYPESDKTALAKQRLKALGGG